MSNIATAALPLKSNCIVVTQAIIPAAKRIEAKPLAFHPAFCRHQTGISWEVWRGYETLLLVILVADEVRPIAALPYSSTNQDIDL
jgi:hypothetical protein